MVPICTTMTSIAEIPSAENPDVVIISVGMIPLQYPKRNRTATTNTEGTKALVFVETTSPNTNNNKITTAHCKKSKFSIGNPFS